MYANTRIFTRPSPLMPHQALYDDMRRQLRVSEEFAARMQLLHPTLLSWLGAEAGEEVWHRVHVSHMGGCGCGPGCGDCGDCGDHHGSGGSGRGGEEGHHVIRGRDHDAYVVTQSDITEVVLGERRVCQLQEQQQALLKEILPMEVRRVCRVGHVATTGSTQGDPSDGGEECVHVHRS